MNMEISKKIKLTNVERQSIISSLISVLICMYLFIDLFVFYFSLFFLFIIKLFLCSHIDLFVDNLSINSYVYRLINLL
jgi:hypothetical protein